MTPEQFDAALTELEWKGSDFCARAGLVPNTVWRWRKSLAPIPPWVGEYLRAVLAVQRLHAEFVAVRRPVRQSAGSSSDGGMAASATMPASTPESAESGAGDR